MRLYCICLWNRLLVLFKFKPALGDTFSHSLTISLLSESKRMKQNEKAYISKICWIWKFKAPFLFLGLTGKPTMFFQFGWSFFIFFVLIVLYFVSFLTWTILCMGDSNDFDLYEEKSFGPHLNWTQTGLCLCSCCCVAYIPDGSYLKYGGRAAGTVTQAPGATWWLGAR